MAEKEARELVAAIEPIWVRLQVFYTPAEAVAWLYLPQPLLDGRRALDMIRDGEGDAVRNLLEAMDAGVYL